MTPERKKECRELLREPGVKVSIGLCYGVWNDLWASVGFYYRAKTLEQAKKKIAQYPKGTVFSLSVYGQIRDERRAEVLAEVQKFIESHGMTAEEFKPAGLDLLEGRQVPPQERLVEVHAFRRPPRGDPQAGRRAPVAPPTPPGPLRGSEGRWAGL